ncbi:hypothetical protein HII31_00565 [Pseudocercospora fuligena]|uniref:F-box domain-containing protein n=1 Tax=Pseudocercospora fuligena TaxID=685502 RepID=A0A8H6VRT4_9PEZI|nr:hypothetical protein HII31_00565 [Pseudocercospora fuligena]
MEAIAASAAAAVAGPSSTSEVSTPAYEDDSRHGHFAISTSQIPKATPTTSPLGAGSTSPEVGMKDAKSIGTRFHEDCHETDLASPRLRSSRMFKGKGKEAVAIEKEKKKPLRLLDLPVDILKDIIKEVTHTNDLTSLALCHSALHRLTTPHIYSRFDIVWPDSSTHAEPRSGVDALTYGLATLVMAEEIFGESPTQRQHAENNRFTPAGSGIATDMQVRRRRGNHYAQFTRKFSLGNGPADWVQEYLISKEGGKMLGTLVALAVARMRSLETFIWDMPTGILRDVWIALSSLGDRDDANSCRLEKVWVRWHNNSSADDANPMPPPPPPINMLAVPPPPLQTPSSIAAPPQIHPAALDRVEHPSFSVLPALKSLSVLDIDELAYLDEMAVLVGKSLHKLKELRVGIARHALTKDWVTVWEGDSLQQVDPDYPTAGSLTIGEKRLGGVLGILTGFVTDMRKPRIVLPDRTRRRRTTSRISQPAEPPAVDAAVTSTNDAAVDSSEITSLRDVISELPGNEPESPLSYPDAASPTAVESLITDAPLPDTINDDIPLVSGALPDPPALDSSNTAEEVVAAGLQQTERTPRLGNLLQLESLELERVPISVPVLQKGIDWTRLTALTLLNCPNHEQLWKTLRRHFAPTPKSPTYPHPRRTSTASPKKGSKSSIPADAELEFRLRLKKVHTNTVSPALVSFLKETLAPNSLEVLFLQEARTHSSSVPIETIFRGPLRRHRNSLKKVLIDSSEKGPDGMPNGTSRWRKWMLTRDILSFICSGKMPALRELGMAIDYRDWHFFLQHLPSIPHLRSLYLPFLADHVHGANLDPRELALQIVDIVALRPEVELCYMGIANKCFEILENKRDTEGRSTESALGIHPSAVIDPDIVGSDDEEDEDEDHDGEADMEMSDDDPEDETESDEDDLDDDTNSEMSSAETRNTARLRLREILFYDDKVAIFKARHGRL